uniref:Probable ubiquitin carboxyl-terminal hydrolase MINDY-4 n=1 Tax=Chromera velia CCMP2878 TaxID=1169474 RepID=A0A0G4I896_9ALVE|eukprot:Cvel_11792.t1-p1 / transcript=Cvel_11792.t1 / gene=Cvel_11792 / organism=Chromera_velia_CCMP2878 / gene_product=Protein FAM188B, putative / transcript_product=Protein FAM188B, putative / location=Cvel_scaffold750:21624-30568(+) / protein_length=502 / sequence_SO=supercontig / SO=protein_coding / is_pseudo=false
MDSAGLTANDIAYSIVRDYLKSREFTQALHVLDGEVAQSGEKEKKASRADIRKFLRAEKELKAHSHGSRVATLDAIVDYIKSEQQEKEKQHRQQTGGTKEREREPLKSPNVPLRDMNGKGVGLVTSAYANPAGAVGGMPGSGAAGVRPGSSPPVCAGAQMGPVGSGAVGTAPVVSTSAVAPRIHSQGVPKTAFGDRPISSGWGAGAEEVGPCAGALPGSLRPSGPPPSSSSGFRDQSQRGSARDSGGGGNGKTRGTVVEDLEVEDFDDFESGPLGGSSGGGGGGFREKEREKTHSNGSLPVSAQPTGLTASGFQSVSPEEKTKLRLLIFGRERQVKESGSIFLGVCTCVCDVRCQVVGLQALEEAMKHGPLAEAYRRPQGSGVILLMCSVALSRGVDRVLKDGDGAAVSGEGGVSLMGRHQYCTQEFVNLCLQGKAVSNVFDGTMTMGREGEGCVLTGIRRQSEYVSPTTPSSSARILTGTLRMNTKWREADVDWNGSEPLL